MVYRVVIVSKKKFPLQEISDVLNKILIFDIEIVIAEDFDAAENYLFDLNSPVILIVVDFQLKNISERICNLKNDELFRYLRFFALLPARDNRLAASALKCGCEVFLAEEDIEELFILQLRIVLYQAMHSEETMERVSRLQEKAIRDFILLDMIKDYIPRTTWNRARVCADEQKISLPGEESNLVICFGDICSFSTLSQHKKPQDIVDMINEVFEVATRHIFYRGGDIDKFIGDAFLAVFSDVVSAVKAMYGLQKELYDLNQEKREKGEEVVSFRIGVHKGPIVRGNVGGHHRFDNTLIGDAVNTASRLEGKSPHEGFVISEAIRLDVNVEIPDEYKLMSSLKGREGEEIYYSVFDYIKENPELFPEMHNLDEVLALKNENTPLLNPASPIGKEENLY